MPSLPTSQRTGIRRVAPTMGTMASIVVHDDAPTDDVDTAIDAVLAELERLEAIFSTYRADSVISAINRGERHPLDGPAEVIDVLDSCTWLEQVTGGALPRPPPRAALPVRSRRLREGLGDRAGHGRARRSRARALVRLRRRRPAGPWTAGRWTAVADRCGRPAPPRPGPRLLRPPRRRGRHVGHGRARPAPVGRPDRAVADALASVTVLGPHLTWADALATSAFALGHAGLDWTLGLEGYEARRRRHDGHGPRDPGLQLAGAAA